MKRGRADRILWDIGCWHKPVRSKKAKRRWSSRRLVNSRKVARADKFQEETIRRCEVFYVDARG